jgi:hypothetical protein
MASVSGVSSASAGPRPIFGLGRAAVPCCTTLQTSDPVVVQIAHIPRRAPMTLDADNQVSQATSQVSSCPRLDQR